VWAFGLLAAVALYSNPVPNEELLQHKFRSAGLNNSHPWGYADMDESLPLCWVNDNIAHICTKTKDITREVVLAMIRGCLTESPKDRLQTPGIVWALQSALLAERFGISLHRSVPTDKESRWSPSLIASSLLKSGD